MDALQKKHDALKVKAQTLKNKNKKKEDPEVTASGADLEKLRNDLLESERSFKEQLEGERSQVEKLQSELSHTNQQHETFVHGLNQSFSEQLVEFEKNFNQVQEANDLLNKELDEMKSSFGLLKKENEELGTKLVDVEQQNAKYKAKLKQFIKKQQLQQQLKHGSLLSETASGRMTPMSISIPGLFRFIRFVDPDRHMSWVLVSNFC